MATIPQAQDYGARPSLMSNRVDLPGNDDLATGDALTRAASTFATMYGQQQDEKDRLNYSLASNELLTADITEREKYKDDDDWATYDDRYAGGFNAARDEILARYQLSPSSNALLGARADLIRERGRVQVGDAARVKKLDQGKASVEANLFEAHEQVLNLDPDTANDLMRTQMDNIKAAEGEGIYTDVEALGLSQKFVQTTAEARLDVMDVEDRIAELKLSLAHRKARGAISPEDLQAGKGSGSIADFLNKDVAVEMLRKAEDENRVSNIQGDAFAIIDQVVADNPVVDSASFARRKQEARDMLDKNDPDYGAKRNFLESELSQRNAEQKAIVDLSNEERGLRIMDQIRDGRTVGELALEIGELPAAQQVFMQNFSANWKEREGFAEATDPDMAYAWHHFTPRQKIDAQINGAEWRTQFTRDDWNRMLAVQEAYSASAGKKDPNIFSGDSADEVLGDMLVGPGKLFAREPLESDTENSQRYRRISKAVNDAITDESLKLYLESGSGKMQPQDVRRITSETIGQMVFVDDWGANTLRTMAGLSQAERRGGAVYVDIDEIRALPAPANSQGDPQTMVDYLRNLAGANDPSDRDIEKAYFLFLDGDFAGAEAQLMGQ